MKFTSSDTRLTELGGRSRPPAVAGYFYPAEGTRLEATLAAMLAEAGTEGAAPKALIAPHAGYVYSGPVAARAYALLAGARQRIRRVVLLGPAHRVYVRGLALPSVQRFDTPLGSVPLDEEAVRRLRALPQVEVSDTAHAAEHSLEVHVPFLQHLLDDFTLVPLVVGEATPEEVAEVLQLLWGGEETLIVISTDLSHYHDYATARHIDAATSAAIERLDLESIGPEQACGCMPLRGLLHLCRKTGLRVRRLDLRNSGDTAGSRDRVVGYGAYAVDAAPALAEHADTLLRVARTSIENGLSGRGLRSPDATAYAPTLRQRRAAFVTLTVADQLRGCMGTTEARTALVNAVAESAFNAAFRDPRFPTLTQAEYGAVAIGISVLSHPLPLAFASESELLGQLVPGIHGLIIERGERRATFLPGVWESLRQSREFLDQLKRKAGLADAEVPERAWVYTTESVHG
ncbi:MAG TPA: AmmeMemoRadiSam system protein B [Gammaproteobacteria bacterium]